MSHHYSGPDFGFPHGDAHLDLTDLYAFPKPGEADKSILIMNVHPSAVVNPAGPTTREPFAPEALYEFKVDTNGDAVADIAYRVRFSSAEDGSQTATLRRVEGAQAAGTGDGGQIMIEAVPVSMGRDARVTEAGRYRFFAGWRSDPFFFDTRGALNDLQFTGDDFFIDKDVCRPSNDQIRHIVSQAKTSIDFRKIMDEGKIFLILLSPQLERNFKAYWLSAYWKALNGGIFTGRYGMRINADNSICIAMSIRGLQPLISGRLLMRRESLKSRSPCPTRAFRSWMRRTGRRRLARQT